MELQAGRPVAGASSKGQSEPTIRGDRQGTHLDLPPAVCRPRLVYETLEILAVVSEKLLGIPPKFTLQIRVMQQTSYPVPALNTPQRKHNTFTFIHRRNVGTLELEYNNSEYIRYIQQANNHRRRTPWPYRSVADLQVFLTWRASRREKS